MRKYMLCLLLATGCGQSMVPSLLGSNTPEVIVSDNYTLNTSSPNGVVTPATYSVMPGKGMVVLKWTATVANVSAVVSDRLVIDCLDEQGKILAEDDVACVVKPGEQVAKSGEFDVPETAVLKIRRVVVGLMTCAK